jgi:hypothetical protein
LTDGVVGSRVKIGAWFVAEDRDRAFDGASEADNPLQERTTIKIPLLTLDVRLTDQFGLQAAASIPDVTRSAIVHRGSSSVTFSETFRGLGDTSVLGWYRLRPLNRWNTIVTFGTSVPTGRTERPRFRPELQDGDLVPTSRLQRGSGTIDPLFGASVTRLYRPYTVFASVAARTPLFENAYGLRTGASSEVNAGVARDLGTHRVTALVRLGWLHRGQDMFGGVKVLVGGGDWIYATPGVAVQVGKGINVQAEVKVPVQRWLANKQLDSSAILQVGVSRAF